jgi:hypothetical protein
MQGQAVVANVPAPGWPTDADCLYCVEGEPKLWHAFRVPTAEGSDEPMWLHVAYSGGGRFAETDQTLSFKATEYRYGPSEIHLVVVGKEPCLTVDGRLVRDGATASFDYRPRHDGDGWGLGGAPTRCLIGYSVAGLLDLWAARLGLADGAAFLAALPLPLIRGRLKAMSQHEDATWKPVEKGSGAHGMPTEAQLPPFPKDADAGKADRVFEGPGNLRVAARRYIGDGRGSGRAAGMRVTALCFLRADALQSLDTSKRLWLRFCEGADGRDVRASVGGEEDPIVYCDSSVQYYLRHRGDTPDTWQKEFEEFRTNREGFTAAGVVGPIATELGFASVDEFVQALPLPAMADAIGTVLSLATPERVEACLQIKDLAHRAVILHADGPLGLPTADQFAAVTVNHPLKGTTHAGTPYTLTMDNCRYTEFELGDYGIRGGGGGGSDSSGNWGAYSFAIMWERGHKDDEEHFRKTDVKEEGLRRSTDKCDITTTGKLDAAAALAKMAAREKVSVAALKAALGKGWCDKLELVINPSTCPSLNPRW